MNFVRVRKCEKSHCVNVFMHKNDFSLNEINIFNY